MFSFLGCTGNDAINHKEFSRAIKRAGNGGLKSNSMSSRPSTRSSGSGRHSRGGEKVAAYVIPPGFRSLLLVVPTDYIPVSLTLPVAHRLIWQIYTFAAQRFCGNMIRLPEIIFDYFVLNYNEAHAAEVRAVDFLTATKLVATGKSMRVDTFVHLLGRADAIAEETTAANAVADDSGGGGGGGGRRRRKMKKRPNGSEEANYFISVFNELLREVGSVHLFLEDHQSGLHMVETLTARRVLQNLPAYKVASDDQKENLDVDLDDHSLIMGAHASANTQEMISVDDVMHLAMSLWQDERKTVQELLQKLFIDADDNDDGFLTLDEFRNMIAKIDPKRPAIGVARMYREALALSPMGGGGLTPEAFAAIGIKHGLLLQKKVSSAPQGNPVDKKGQQANTDGIMLAEMKRAWAEQKDVFREACSGDSVKSHLKAFEDALAKKDVATAMALFGTLCQETSGKA